MPGLQENMKFQHKTRINNQIKSDDRPENTRFDPLTKMLLELQPHQPQNP